MPLKDLEQKKAYDREYSKRNREKRRLAGKRYSDKNRELLNQKSREYRLVNREVCNKRVQISTQKNPGKKAAKEAKRRAVKLNATPVWSELEAIKDFYINRPEDYHVDHIIPLKGKTVCGLHVLDNLQYLSACDNLKKSNKFYGVNYE